jgi:hypothetical protein
MNSAVAPPPQPKRSFLRLPVEIDAARLLADYGSIPALAWATSHWETHCSSDMLLLRGGDSGTAEDFVTADTRDHEILAEAPYLAWLIDKDGPFGGAVYAFLFRMKPTGVARPHTDDDPAWKQPLRVHVPIITNDGAFLLSRGRAKHLAVGEAWTFDNQAMHAAVNGETVRTHLIMDVPRNPRIESLLANAIWDQGLEDPLRWLSACAPNRPPIAQFATAAPLSPAEKQSLGLGEQGFAARIAALSPGDLAGSLNIGDVVVAVDGVTECPVARTALDYVSLRYNPGDTVVMDIIRGPARLAVSQKLASEGEPTPAAGRIA